MQIKEEKNKKGFYRKKIGQKGPERCGWECAHTYVFDLLVQLQLSFYVKTINRKIRSGRGDFQTAETSSLVVFHLQTCIKMVIK